MGYLLSFGVIAFQVAILVTILGAAKAGRKLLLITTTGWIIFTLFGSIFTTGLLLLQLLTIFISYRIGKKIISQASLSPEPTSPTKVTKASGWLITAALIAAGTLTGKYFGRLSANSEIENVKQIRAEAARPPQAIAPPPLESTPQNHFPKKARKRINHSRESTLSARQNISSKNSSGEVVIHHYPKNEEMGQLPSWDDMKNKSTSDR